MSGKITLWQAVKDRLVAEQTVTPQELQVFNPAGLKIKDFVSVDHPEVFGKQFVVVELDVYDRSELGKVSKFVNYVLQDDEDKFAHLRMYPVANTDPYAKKHSDVLLLFPDGERDFDKDFLEVKLAAETLDAVIAEGEAPVQFWRVCKDSTKPFEAAVTVVDSSENPPKKEEYLYWDYFRKTADGEEEFYFVEMSNDTGKFQMFRGFRVAEEDVEFRRRKV